MIYSLLLFFLFFFLFIYFIYLFYLLFYLFTLFIILFIYYLFQSTVVTYRLYFDDQKIRVAQKNIIEEKLLEIKRSIRRGTIYLFQIRIF